jgi:alpha-beta hydrolase superfamily lysophospholipase
MHHEAFWLNSSDATPLYVNRWSPEAPPKAAIMLAHGMAEHSGRYDRLGGAMTAAGYELFALDQRGHGQTASHGRLGHYADDNGWNLVIDDLACLNHHIRQRHPQTPIFLLGHSMGSYIGQAYLMHHSCSLQGAILSGSNYQPIWLYRLARLVARFERWRQGAHGRSKLIDLLSFGSFNKSFKPNRTTFDWLSRDPREVDNYIDDPLCGFLCTNQLWLDLLGGLQHISQTQHLEQIDSDLPLLVIGGDHDPVSAGKRLHDLSEALRQAGLKRVQLKTYPDARHELLNERNRDEVTAYLIGWLDEALGHSRHRTRKAKETP